MISTEAIPATPLLVPLLVVPPPVDVVPEPPDEEVPLVVPLPVDGVPEPPDEGVPLVVPLPVDVVPEPPDEEVPLVVPVLVPPGLLEPVGVPLPTVDPAVVGTDEQEKIPLVKKPQAKRLKRIRRCIIKAPPVDNECKGNAQMAKILSS